MLAGAAAARRSAAAGHCRRRSASPATPPAVAANLLQSASHAVAGRCTRRTHDGFLADAYLAVSLIPAVQWTIFATSAPRRNEIRARRCRAETMRQSLVRALAASRALPKWIAHGCSPDCEHDGDELPASEAGRRTLRTEAAQKRLEPSTSSTGRTTSAQAHVDARQDSGPRVSGSRQADHVRSFGSSGPSGACRSPRSRFTRAFTASDRR